MRKRFFLLFAGTTFVFSAYTQPNYYIVEQKTAAYTELANDTTVPGAFSSASGVWMLELTGEKFTFFDKVHTIDNVKSHIVFSNNGFVRVEDDSTFIVVDAAFTYSDSIDANSRLSYIVEGTPGARIIKVQWKNLKLTNGPAGNYLNYQVWLYQKTGVFEIYYGPSAGNQSGYTATTGPNIGLFYSLTDFSKMFEKIWLKGLPANYSIDSTKNVSFPSVDGLPVSGNMIRFVPRKVANNIPGMRGILSGVYPNPAHNQVMIQFDHPVQNAGVMLTDLYGRPVFRQVVAEANQRLAIPVTTLSDGLYVLTVETDGEKESRMISVQH